MAIKKSDLYSSLWAGANVLRGGMAAHEYKDYVLVILFIKYVSDKAAADKQSLISVPEDASFDYILSLKGSKNIGEEIDKAIGRLAKENDLNGVIDVVSFNDASKLGEGKNMVDTLTKLVAIFERDGLDFGKNQGNGDDILGDAFEYLMQNFATESGKSKGEFYTPAEVSRIIARIIGVSQATSASQTIYDPACGSGSLLLKAAYETELKLSVYGQELERATAGLAKMNMILHDNATAEIFKGYSTLSDPQFQDKHGYLKTFDFVVANPPFSLKEWKKGFKPEEDVYQRFDGFGIPPDKNGDYAWLLHVVKSLNRTGKGAIILPHGVLFRGNAEADIRKSLINKGLIKGIIGLPANLFFGTGIPACIIVLDKEGAAERDAIFMIDASKGYMKDGPKNRLREQDIHRITDVFTKQLEQPRYSRMVPIAEIADARNEYNLNIPRYIDSREPEDLHDIEAHLLGGIPILDIDALVEYWKAYPSLKTALFSVGRPGYYFPTVPKEQLRETIFNHPEFIAFTTGMAAVFNIWAQHTKEQLKNINPATLKPKQLIRTVAEELLIAYSNKPLVDRYDIYQHLLDYWQETMADDCYLIAAEGWKAEPYRIIINSKDRGWTCDLVPPDLVKAIYFATELHTIAQHNAEAENLSAEITALEEEHDTEGGYFDGWDTVNLKAVKAKLKRSENSPEERELFANYVALSEKYDELTKTVKRLECTLDLQALAKYSELTVEQIKSLVVEHKWLATIEQKVNEEMEKISQSLTSRLKELVSRYETPLPQLKTELATLEEKVNSHLFKMGFVWN